MSLVPGGAARVVLLTVPDLEVGAAIARALLDAGLIACANLVPGLRSIYRWEGEICDEAEVLLLLKTKEERLAALEAAVQALHPYETPEVIALPVSEGAEAYLAWLGAALSGEDRPQEI